MLEDKKPANQEYYTQQNYSSKMKRDKHLPRHMKAEGVHHHKSCLTKNAQGRSPSLNERVLNSKIRTFEPTEMEWGCGHTEEIPCEDMWKRQATGSQEESPQRKPNLPTSSSLSSRLQSRENISFCCLSPPIHGALLW